MGVYLRVFKKYIYIYILNIRINDILFSLDLFEIASIRMYFNVRCHCLSAWGDLDPSAVRGIW